MEFERLLLSCMLLQPDMIPDVRVKAYHFKNLINRQVYEAILNANDAGAVDCFTVKSYCHNVSLDYIMDLTMLLPSTTNWRAYENEVIEQWRKSELQVLAASLYAVSDVQEAITKARYKLDELEVNAEINDQHKQIMDYADSLNQPHESFKTGFPMLDNLTGGLPYGEVTIIGARPAVGKTAFACNIVCNHLDSLKVGLFSLEMNYKQIATRILCIKNNINGYDIRERDPDAINRVVMSLPVLNRVIIDDSSGYGLDELNSKIRRIVKEHNIRCVIIDYLGLLVLHSKATRNEQISDISQGLKRIAKELNICVIALSQLSRLVTQRSDPKPILSDLRDSGSLEQDAAVVMFLHREEGAMDAELLVRKNREGEVGMIPFVYEKRFTKFSEKQIF